MTDKSYDVVHRAAFDAGVEAAYKHGRQRADIDATYRALRDADLPDPEPAATIGLP